MDASVPGASTSADAFLPQGGTSDDYYPSQVGFLEYEDDDEDGRGKERTPFAERSKFDRTIHQFNDDTTISSDRIRQSFDLLRNFSITDNNSSRLHAESKAKPEIEESTGQSTSTVIRFALNKYVSFNRSEAFISFLFSYLIRNMSKLWNVIFQTHYWSGKFIFRHLDLFEMLVRKLEHRRLSSR